MEQLNPEEVILKIEYYNESEEIINMLSPRYIKIFLLRRRRNNPWIKYILDDEE
jgi:hypothetical protein